MRWLRRVAVAVAVVATLFLSLWFWVLHTESGANRVWQFAKNATGGQLAGSRIEGDLGGGAELGELRWQSETVDVSAQAVSVRVNVDLMPPVVNVEAMSVGRVEIETRESGDSTEAASSPGEIALGLRLPVAIRIDDLKSGPIILRRPNSEPLSVDAVSLSAYWHDVLEIHGLTANREDIEAVIAGTVLLQDAVPIDVQADVRRGSESARLALRGDLDKSDFTLAVDGEPGAATGHGILQLGDAVAVSGDFEVAAFHLARYWDAWPATHPLSGDLSVAWSGDSVTVDRANVRGGDAVVAVDGSYNIASGDIDTTLRWSDVQWPIDAAAPRLASGTGDVVVAGDLDNWTVRGTLEIGTTEMPDGRFVVDANGDRDGAAAVISEGRAFGGTLAGEVAYRWRDAQPWNADIEFTTIGTSSLLPDWPAVLSGSITADGTQRPFSINAVADDVAGELRGMALQLDGAFSHDDTATSADNLYVEHGGLKATLDGSADTPEGLRFDGSVAALENYLDMVAGSATASGILSRAGDNPYLVVNLESPQLTVGEIAFVDVDLDDRRSDNGIVGFVLDVGRIDGLGPAISGARVEFDYAPDRQSLTVTGEQLESSFEIGIAGAFADWRRPLESDWSGDVTAFALELDDEHALGLEHPAQLQLSGSSVSVSDFCAAGGAGASICADFRRDDMGSLALSAEVGELPVDLVEHFIDAPITFDQTIGGTLEWAREAGGEPSGRADLAISPGSIKSLEDPDLAIVTEEGQIGFEIINGELLSGNALVPMPGTGEINARFRVLDVTRALDSGIEGGVQVSMNDIALLAEFSPLIDAIGGRIDVSLTVAGSVSEPVVTGDMRMNDGEIYYGPIGMHLEDIQLAGTLSGTRSFQIEGQFRAGDGQGHVISSADYASAEEPGLQFRVRGTDLLLVDVPDLQATVAPTLDIDFSEGHLAINGSVNIPRARITPANLAESRVGESDDVVIVAGSLPDAQEKATESELEYSGELTVTLGNDVRVDLDVANASLVGSSVFTWQGDPIPKAQGRFDLAGSIEAFGQVLNIAEGGIRFPNVPANDPYIRLRAERDIYGNTQVKHAGVLVDGPASRPSIEAYTVPLTTEERALTLLVTGSDFDYEQGVGAVDFGTYIAPRLFVSYGVGIFDRDNVISARYDLKRGFGIKASSGSKESGIDLNYRFEN